MTTCKIFFIHGIDNQGGSADRINTSWFEALKSAWIRDGHPFDTIQFETAAAFYGDKLASLTRNWLNNEFTIIDQGAEEGETIDPALIMLYQEYEEALLDSGKTAPSLGPEEDIVVTEMGFPHHKSVKALARVIEALSPEDGSFLAKKFLPQAAVYIRRPGAATAVDNIVEEQLQNFLRTSPKSLIIAHSLGTVVGYRILRKLTSDIRFPLFMTLGSPLASVAIQKVLPIPRITPNNTDKWVNAADRRDFVALHPVLNADSFGAAKVINLSGVQNNDENRHSIVGYLNNPLVSNAIWDIANIQ